MDKDNVHIDSEFIDHSWQNMSELLDQEMPVQKRKRRFLWLWFFGVGMVLLGSFAYLKRSTPVTVKSLPIPKTEPIASANTPLNNDQKINSSSTINKKNLKKEVLKKSSDDLQAGSTIINLTETIPTAAHFNTAVGTSVPEKVADYPLSVSKHAITEKEALTPTKTSPQRTVLPVLTELSKLPISLLLHKRKEEVLPVFPSKNRPNWQFGVYAGALIPQSGSFRAGFHANVSFNPKWTLHFGLGYAKRIPTASSISSSPNADVLTVPDLEIEEADMNTAGAGAAPVEPTTNEMEAVALNGFQYANFHYFELPILVQYRIRPRFSVELGGSLSYLYGYRYQYNEASFFTKDINANASFSTIRATNLTQENIGTINKYPLAFIGGVNYQLTKHLNGYTNFHLSNQYLQPSTISTFQAKKWKQIEVGIRYYFK